MMPTYENTNRHNHPEISHAGKPAQTGGMKKW